MENTKTNAWWTNVIEQYEELLEKDNDILPQLELVRKIAKSKYSETIYPVSYTHALNLSKTVDYKESLKTPSISVKYLKDGNFRVSYLPNSIQTHNTDKYTCHFSEIWSLLESLFLRLELDSIKNSSQL